MKSGRYQKRFYRSWVGAKDLHAEHIVARETDLQILTDKPLDKNFIRDKLNSYRLDVENYISRDRRFLVALKPLEVEQAAPEIVRHMAACAQKANVGPMATVAGAIAQYLGEDLVKKGYKNVIIENGGDIFLKSTRGRLIGLYAGRSKRWNDLRLEIRPQDTPMGICTSSATIGHSLSFGYADSVVILARNACLADAVATATCNQVQSKEDLKTAVEFARKIRGVVGVVIILKSHLVSWGKIKFVR